ncbi:rod shape-determining protein RodA [bacterium]|nr:rod shape-determining protein RodA [bacterium]
MKLRELVRSLDWLLIGAALLLVMVGLAMLFSSTSAETLSSSRFVRQVFSLGVALVVGFLVVRLPYHNLSRYAGLLYGLGLAGLVAVFLTAQVIRGATSRLSVSDFQLQPSEFMKIAVVIFLAWVFSRDTVVRGRALIVSAAAVAIPAIFILLEPDLGVAAMLVAVWVALLIFIGVRWYLVASIGVLGAIGFLAGWFGLFADYQKARLLVFLYPARDPLGAGYNIVQSIVALGSGRLFGRGLGHGPQSQLQFLPERHTDFVLASIGEELGFVGILVVVILYAIVLWRIALIARTTRDQFGQLLAVSVFLLMVIGFVVSAGMNMGLLPVTGIPLPLVSYGGSNLLSTFVLLAIVESVHVYSKWVQAPPTDISQLT